MQTLRLIVLALVFAMLGACGGGGGSSTPTQTPENDPPAQPPPPSPPPNEMPGGIWFGTTTIDGTAGSPDFVGLSTDDGRFRFLSFDTAGQFVGTSTISGSSVTGSGTGYAAIGFTWIDGSVFTNISIAGTISERIGFTGIWEADTGESGTFSFLYDSLHQRDSSLSLIADVWTALDEFGNLIGTVTIDTAGRIDGQDVAGCLYSGSVSIIDSDFNVYDVSLTITNCGAANGDYSGLGVLTDAFGKNDSFVYSVDNGTLAVIDAVFR